MEIVSIEKKTFEMMVAAFGALSGEGRRPEAQKRATGRMERWLTGEEVCGQLRISPRTLQTLRDRRLIGYSQIQPQVLLQARGGEAADTACRHALSARTDDLFDLNTDMIMNENNDVFTMEGESVAVCGAGYAQGIQMAVRIF